MQRGAHLTVHGSWVSVIMCKRLEGATRNRGLHMITLLSQCYHVQAVSCCSLHQRLDSGCTAGMVEEQTLHSLMRRCCASGMTRVHQCINSIVQEPTTDQEGQDPYVYWGLNEGGCTCEPYNIPCNPTCHLSAPRSDWSGEVCEYCLLLSAGQRSHDVLCSYDVLCVPFCVSVRLYVHMCIYMHIHTHTHARTHTHTYAHTKMHTYTHACTHTRTHTYTYTRTYTRMRAACYRTCNCATAAI